MFHRAVAITATLLAALGVAFAVPAVSHIGGVQAALAGDDDDVPSDDLTNENGPTPPQQPAEPVPPPPAPEQAPPPAAPAPPPAAPAPQELPPVPQDTLEDGGSNDSQNESGNSNGGSNRGEIETSTPQLTKYRRLSVSQSNTSTLSDTGAIPQGGAQAGGGGTAPSVTDAGSSTAVLGGAAGLVLLATGTGLVLRRRLGSQ
jgi:hypothetical protein